MLLLLVVVVFCLFICLVVLWVVFLFFYFLFIWLDLYLSMLHWGNINCAPSISFVTYWAPIVYILPLLTSVPLEPTVQFTLNIINNNNNNNNNNKRRY